MDSLAHCGKFDELLIVLYADFEKFFDTGHVLGYIVWTLYKSTHVTNEGIKLVLFGLKVMVLSAYLHCKATVGSNLVQEVSKPSPDRSEDPKTPQIDGGDGAGGSPEDEEDFEDSPVASESSLDEADDDSTRAGIGQAMKPDPHSVSWRFLI